MYLVTSTKTSFAKTFAALTKIRQRCGAVNDCVCECLYENHCESICGDGPVNDERYDRQRIDRKTFLSQLLCV